MLKSKDLLYIQQNPQKVLDEFTQIEKAMSGNMKLNISPATVNRTATTAAWSRTVTITLTDKDGNLLDFYSGDLSVSIADTSTAGTATITDTTPPMVNGVCKVVVSSAAAAWVAEETNTLTLANQVIMGYTLTGATSVETIVA
jgi:hypothetical protein